MKLFVMGSMCLLYCLPALAQVKIGGNATPPPASAVLELDGGSNKGLLLPRMRKQDIDAIQNPAEGLTIYATDEEAVYLRRSLVWEKQSPFNLPANIIVNSEYYGLRIENIGLGPAMIGVPKGGGAGFLGHVGPLGWGVGIRGESFSKNGVGGYFLNFEGGEALIVGQGKTGIGSLHPEATLHIDGKFNTGPTVIVENFQDAVIQFRKDGVVTGSLSNTPTYMQCTNSIGSFNWAQEGNPLTSLMGLRKKSGVNGKGVLNVSTSISVGNFGGEFPNATLHVRGTPGDYPYTMLVQQTGGNPLIALQNDGLDKGFIQLVGNDMKVGTFATNDLGNFVIRTNGSDRIVVRPDGKMVLGSPTGSAPVSNHLLAVKGRIAATEFTVTALAAWPDYVFAPGYQLKSLEETESFIKHNNHLPGIPAAAVVEKEGYDIGDMQKRMMEKIEELTLHLIKANKAIQQQSQEIAELKKDRINTKF